MPPVPSPKSDGGSLIIITGDISDVDGFQELAYYAKHTNADVLFIMNYPNLLDPKSTGVAGSDPKDPYILGPGLGYKFDVEQADSVKSAATPPLATFSQYYKNYTGVTTAIEKTKAAMTDLGFKIVNKIWDEVQGNSNKGKLHFCIGGVNKVNPFSPSIFKNEMDYYSEVVDTYNMKSIIGYSGQMPQPGTTFSSDGSVASKGIAVFPFSQYSDIYMSFTGAPSFWNPTWEAALTAVKDKIRGLFVMGGVLSDHQPNTMSSVPAVLNRFSFATMNQIYHPENAKKLFDFYHGNKLPMFTVTNNASSNDFKSAGGFDAIKRALASVELTGPSLIELSEIFYMKYLGKGNPGKLFDLYVGIAIAHAVNQQNTDTLKYRPSTLFFEPMYAGTILTGPGRSASVALSEFRAMAQNKRDEIAFSRPGFKGELEQLAKFIKNSSSFFTYDNEVYELRFSVGTDKRQVYTASMTHSNAAAGKNQGFDANQVAVIDSQSLTPLMFAAANGHLNNVRSLIAYMTPEQINKQTDKGETALMLGASSGHDEIVKILIQNNASFGDLKLEGGEDALMLAASSAHANMVKLLLNSNADPNAKRSDGKTALMLATTEDVKKLLQFPSA